MTGTLIDRLAELRGIESNYTDAWGKPAEISTESKAKLLVAMGYPVDDDAALTDMVDQQSARIWMNPLNPVQVNRMGDQVMVDVRLPIELVNDAYRVEVVTEQGETHTQGFVPTDGELINASSVDDSEFQEYVFALNMALPLGYHSLNLKAEDGDQLAQMRLIIAPKRCYKPAPIEAGEKVWGLSVQLYCVRSQTNWGIGDFTDLQVLLQQAGARGAQFVGLNPIHALYPNNPDGCSPYSPSSRRWLNTIYLDVTAIDGYGDTAVQELVNTQEFQTRLGQLRATDHVDYQGVTHIKLQALNAVFEVFDRKHLRGNSKVNKAFKAFVEQGGESLQNLALFDAIQEHLAGEGKPSWGWPVFPKAFNQATNPEVAKFGKRHAKRVKFYLFLQWQCAQQLEAANQAAKEAGMMIGLYRDLAVGVSEGSAEIWGNQSLYSTDASVGAPPDVLGPLGQNWGLPPMDPDQLFQQQYQPIVELFRSNMESCGALRIDHVMALLRLWWVAREDGPKNGGYVYYPVDDLLGILALESHRHQSLVIGEDLGTVPDEIRDKLAENGVHSYRVFFFEQAEDGGFFSPSHYPEQSMSTLTTHDMPTLIGYWHCLDLELGKELGLYPTEEILSTLYASRHSDKQEILNTLHGHTSIPDWIGRDVNHVSMNKELNHGMQIHMARGSSAMLSLQLEDWLEMDKPVNVPGTSTEYPNWRRKLTRNLEDIFTDPALDGLARGLTECRRLASQKA